MSVEIGHRLRQAREAQGYSLDEMEQYTRIPAHDLASLEAGDFSNLSSPYYIRAYLRTYANTLGLNPREVVEAYRSLTKGAADGGNAAGRSYRRSVPRGGGGRGSNHSAIHPPPMGNEGETAGRTEETPLSRSSRSRRQQTGSQKIVGGKAAGRLSREGRRVSMPPDVPEPEELGLSPMRQENREHPSAEGPSLSRSTSRGSAAGKRRGGTKKPKESKFGIWYTRFLILMAILLIPASIYVYLLVTGDDVEQAAGPSGSKEKPGSEQQEPAGEEASNPLLVPVQQGGSGTDRYELAYADQIEVKLKSKGESQFQIREQEVGAQLKDGVLQKGETFSYPYKKGKDLYLQLSHPSSVEVTVNGMKMKTSYEKEKLFHISLVN
ncbi:RodZ domain-containing protein [Kroppenstedtia eburnea]|uniref:Helix-turn-helix domain-containing protein n=1 Tax=Kroppenstedtia eburnea TaxID=714067 RepID=A0A1N7IUG4_9BACL|nr:RodZ domain-containing protein [Kroppenstedtia eburnea]SIS40680.1 Helix-turn-helix domain-containing protein [Kroppenstedtia eburnea]